MNAEFKVDLSNGKHVADVVTWELEKVAVDPAALEALAVECGVDPDILPKAPDAETSYRRAVHTPVPDGWLMRPIKRAGGDLLWGLVRETRDGDRVRHRQAGVLKFDRELELATLDIDAADPEVDAARAVGATLLTRWREQVGRLVTEDITSWLTDTITARWQGFPLRRSGGVYVVLAAHAREVRAVRAMVEAIPATSAHVNLLPQVGVDDTLVAMKREARHSIEVQVRDMAAEVEAFDETTTRASTLARRLEAYRTLRSKLDLYEGSLDLLMGDLRGQVATLEQKVAAMLGLDDADDAEAPAVPTSVNPMP